MTDPPLARLRSLPSVDRLATAVARAELASRRREILAGDDEIDVDLVKRASSRLHGSSAPVLNATGVVLHTNLGRAPLALEARAAVSAVANGYVALELDLATGTRMRRGRRAESLLMALTGAEDALIVNNGAAAVLLATTALAGPGREVLVSRGELVEIGGGLRIADIVAQSGAKLVEVGSTNRTRALDYRVALTSVTGAILRVHQANFQMSGFVERPALGELVSFGVPVIEDLGSGAIGGSDLLTREPAPADSIAAGAALACFSGDKLLGGPQAGILVGATSHVDACRVHPLARALRIDKLCLAALEATLELYCDRADAERRIPALAMLHCAPEELARKTRRLADLTGGEVTEMPTPVGGGSLPNHELSGPAVRLEPGPDGVDAFVAALRSGNPPVIARVHRGAVMLSARTLTPAEVELAGACVSRART